jgi:hypothetical protein
MQCRAPAASSTNFAFAVLFQITTASLPAAASSRRQCQTRSPAGFAGSGKP